MKFSLYLVFLFLLFISQFSLAQLAPEADQCEELLISIRLNRGDVLFEDEYFKLKQQFEKLKTQFRGRSLTSDEIETLRKLVVHLQEINDVSQKVKEPLGVVLNARDKAVLQGARDYAPGIFQNAEAGLHKLAKKNLVPLSRKNEREIAKIVNLYHEAQFQAIRNKLLSEVRILIQESKDLDARKLTPRTFEVVTTLLKEVENILSRRRFDNPSLNEKAAQLSEESLHLLNLVQSARKMKHNDAAFEEFILRVENTLRQIARELDYSPQFGNGIFPVLSNIEESVKDLKAENEEWRRKNAMLSDSIAMLQKQLRDLQRKKVQEEQLASRVEKIKKRLAQYGVTVNTRERSIVLRMNGIEFPPGRIHIDSHYQGVLEQIGKALAEFPVEPIHVRLAQGAGGNLEYSENMSVQRAKAVALVIQNAGFIPEERISAEGIVLPDETDGGHTVVEVVIKLKKEL